MITVPIYKQDGSQVGEAQLPEHLFALPWADMLVHQVVTGIASNQRAATAHTKGRSEVRGGGRKPWRQKGTDRARHGSIRSPLWVGGGVTFGPSKDKQYTKSINKKMRTKAFFTVLSAKVRDDAVVFIDGFSLEKPSTKSAIACVKHLCGEMVDRRHNTCTVVFSQYSDVLRKSFANIPGVRLVALDAFNTKDALSARKLLFMDSAKTIDYLTRRGERLQRSVQGREVQHKGV